MLRLDVDSVALLWFCSFQLLPATVAFTGVASYCSIHWCCHLLQHSLMLPSTVAFTDIASYSSIHWCYHLLQHSLMLPATVAFTDVASYCRIHWCCHLRQPTVDGLGRVQHCGKVAFWLLKIRLRFPKWCWQGSGDRHAHAPGTSVARCLVTAGKVLIEGNYSHFHLSRK